MSKKEKKKEKKKKLIWIAETEGSTCRNCRSMGRQKKNLEKREQQLRVSKRKYPYKQMRKEEREGAIPMKIADLREEGKKISLRKGSGN